MFFKNGMIGMYGLGFSLAGQYF